MSCNVWRIAVPTGGHIDDLPVAERRKVLDHIHDCRRCREVAVASDSSLIFESLPRVEISMADVDQIRASVRTLRRARELENPISRGRWAGRAAAVAALFLVALLLDPRRPEELNEESPFAGALGVGAGQLDLGRATAPSMDLASEEDNAEIEESRPVELGDQDDRTQKELEPDREQLTESPPEVLQ